jgi:DNA-binding transcriptional ArsR family regulator
MTADVFAALSSPVRRRLLELLLEGPSTVNALVARFRLHRPAISEHLQVLRSARLVRDVRQGRERIYYAEPAPLAEIADWLAPFERYWRARLKNLNAVLDEEDV